MEMLSPELFKQYQPPQLHAWRSESATSEQSPFRANIESLDLRQELPSLPEHGNWAFFGCDTLNSGAPNLIRQALSRLQFPLGKTVCDAGDFVGSDLSTDLLRNIFLHLLTHQIHPIILEKEDRSTLELYQTLAQAYPEQDCAVVHCGALLPPKSILDQVVGKHTYIGLQKYHLDPDAVLVAKEHQCELLFADDLHLGDSEISCALVDVLISQVDKIHLSLNLDVFTSCYTPGTCSPQPLGLTPWLLIPTWRHLAASQKVASLAITGFHPPTDINGITAQLVASFIADFLYHQDVVSIALS